MRTFKETSEEGNNEIALICDLINKLKKTDFQVIFPDSKFSTEDALFVNFWEKILVEHKNRKFNSTKLERYGNTLILEKSKYDRLIIEKILGNCDNIYYICSLIDGLVYLFDFSKIDFSKLTIEKRQCSRTSCQDRGFEYKDCYLLPIEYAEIYIK